MICYHCSAFRIINLCALKGWCHLTNRMHFAEDKCERDERMIERAKASLSCDLITNLGISKEEADEYIQEVQYQVNEFLDPEGNSPYDKPEDILQDYLGLPRDYLWVFTNGEYPLEEE